MDLNLVGKTAVITGAGSGIGREMCCLFAKAGAFVVAGDISGCLAEETASLCAQTPKGGSCISCTCDVTDQKSVDAMFAMAASNGRRIDILVGRKVALFIG